jgi:hypothetical protein
MDDELVDRVGVAVASLGGSGGPPGWSPGGSGARPQG